MRMLLIISLCLCTSTAFAQRSADLGPTAQRLQEKGNQVPRPFFRPMVGDDTSSDVSLSTSPREGVQQLNAGQDSAEPSDIVGNEFDKQQTLPTTNDTCLAALKLTAQTQRASHPDRRYQDCIIPDPVELISTGGNAPVRFPSGLKLDCTFATVMSRFISDVAQPLAQRHMGEPLTKLNSGKGFVCRRRNNALTGKLSEHSFGNAMDLVGFEFASGRRLNIRASEDMEPDEAGFFDALRAASCEAFTTVLGPGANDAHATHLHLDLGRSKGNPNPYRICQ